MMVRVTPGTVRLCSAEAINPGRYVGTVGKTLLYYSANTDTQQERPTCYRDESREQLTTSIAVFVEFQPETSSIRRSTGVGGPGGGKGGIARVLGGGILFK